MGFKHKLALVGAALGLACGPQTPANLSARETA